MSQKNHLRLIGPSETLDSYSETRETLFKTTRVNPGNPGQVYNYRFNLRKVIQNGLIFIPGSRPGFTTTRDEGLTTMLSIFYYIVKQNIFTFFSWIKPDFRIVSPCHTVTYPKTNKSPRPIRGNPGQPFWRLLK
ncbi:hypothetical protein DLD82_10870 [Methanospirillum stamsii]|uniref:Uncharacterized protein n=1 Tax=Methanospirillum stamsii TaxID=1277351 RepID=A0A2V2N464_9EURY|nr:hypothetical protein DLD82_10870 [Methanospirillum stamsii]